MPVIGKRIMKLAMAGLFGLAIAGGLAQGWTGTYNPPPGSDMVVVQAGGHALSVSRYEVTREEWRDCVRDGGCAYDPAWPDTLDGSKTPATGIGILDVAEFIGWYNRKTGGAYRLPTREEWQDFSAGLPKSQRKKLFTDPRLAWAADYGAAADVPKELRQQGGFGQLPNGIADLGGSVWEWTGSCARTVDQAHCPAYVAAGLHEAVISIFVRDPLSGGCTSGTPPAHVGFRLVRGF